MCFGNVKNFLMVKNNHFMKNPILYVFAFLLFFSCKKENTNLINTNVADYLPVKVGNSWTYDHFHILPDGTETPEGSETITVSEVFQIGDTTFVSVSYESGNTSLSQYLIPENFYILDGDIVIRDLEQSFLNANQNDTLYQSNIEDIVDVHAYINLEDVPVITVPAGSFDNQVLQKVLEAQSLESDYPHGNPRFAYTYFAKGVGCVWSEIFYYNSPKTLVWKLREFDLN